MILITRTRLRFFYGLCVATCTVTAASMYMRCKVENMMFEHALCKSSIDALQQHDKCMDVLGSPLKFKRPNMRNTFNNATNTDANIAVPVIGSKTAGNLLITAFKEDKEKEWTVKSLELEVPKQKIVIKK